VLHLINIVLPNAHLYKIYVNFCKINWNFICSEFWYSALKKETEI